MKRQVSYLLFLLFALSTFAQPSLQWYKEIGGFSEESGNCIKKISSNVLLLGATSPSNEGEITCGNYGNKDVYLFWLDNAGNIIAQKHYGGTEDDIINDLKITDNKDIIFCGYTQSNDIDIPVNKGNFDAWVVKLDSMGNVIWSKTYGGTNLDVATRLLPLSNGKIWVGAYSHSVDGDKTQSLGNSDFWVLKLDENGGLLNEKSFGGSADDRLYGLCSALDSGIMIAGESFSTNGNMPNNQGSGDMLLVKLTNNADFVWAKNYGASFADYVTDIQSNALNGYYLSGKTYSNNAIFAGNHGKLDFSLVRIDKNGNLIWAKTFGGSENDLNYCLAVLENGDWLMAGNSYSNDMQVAQNYGNADVWIVKGDSAGALNWAKNWGGNDKDEAQGIYIENAQTIYIIGAIRSSIFQDKVLHGNGDILVAKLTQSTTDILNITPTFNLSIQNKVIKIQSAQPYQLDIYNLAGQKMFGASSYHNFSLFDISHLNQGLYCLRLSFNNGQVYTKTWLVE